MTNIETTVKTALETVSCLTGKVFPLSAPAGVEAPFCVYISYGAHEIDSLDGGIGLFEANMELHIVHKSYAGIKALANDVKDALDTLPDNVTFDFLPSDPEQYEAELKAYHKVISIKLTF